MFPKTEDIDAIAHLTPKVEGFSSVLPGAVDLCITVPEWCCNECKVGRKERFVLVLNDYSTLCIGPVVDISYLPGGFKHVLFSISYMGCHPSHWRTHIFQTCQWTIFHLPSGKRLRSYRKSPLWIDKTTISMVMFNSYVTNYQRVYDSLISPFKHLFSCLGDFRASHVWLRDGKHPLTCQTKNGDFPCSMWTSIPTG